ncbi:MAG: hypothetical protein U0Q18_37060 [Bryobacteraceae bacterium]
MNSSVNIAASQDPTHTDHASELAKILGIVLQVVHTVSVVAPTVETLAQAGLAFASMWVKKPA